MSEINKLIQRTINRVLTLSNGASKGGIQREMKGKIIEVTELIGLYARPGQRE